jgi:hypothetical protein
MASFLNKWQANVLSEIENLVQDFSQTFESRGASRDSLRSPNKVGSLDAFRCDQWPYYRLSFTWPTIRRPEFTCTGMPTIRQVDAVSKPSGPEFREGNLWNFWKRIGKSRTGLYQETRNADSKARSEKSQFRL